jgi:hypothetical protein
MVGHILVSASRLSYHLIVSGLVRTFPLEEGLPSPALHYAYWRGRKKPVSYTPHIVISHAINVRIDGEPKPP